MIDLSAAPKRIQELMDEGYTIDHILDEAGLVGITMKVWWQADTREIGWADRLEETHFADDRIVFEFYHKESGTRWFAKFSGYDAEEVEVFGPVNSWIS